MKNILLYDLGCRLNYFKQGKYYFDKKIKILVDQ